MAKIPPPPRKGSPPEMQETLGNLDSGQPELVPLNFKVPKAFHREYKLTAAIDDKDMVDVLKESFAMYKARNNEIQK